MKKDKKRYLSKIIFLYSIIIIAFCGILLCLFWVLIRKNGSSIVFASILLMIYLLLMYIGYQFIIKPYRETTKIMRLFAKGYMVRGIFDLRYPISPEHNAMLKRFDHMLDTKELINLSKKQAEYLALQNQINPHFLYNTLEGIRSEALCAGIEGVAKMAEALSLFFRYTISNVDHLVTLEDELKNVDNYYIIQQFRFEDRLRIIIDIDKEYEQELMIAKIPKLILQPIVENSIYHGLEEKLGQGLVHIKVIGTKERLIINISDNGLGISEEGVDKLNKKLRSVELVEEESKTVRSGIALTNVNSRIQLLFGEEYGLYVYSTLNEGTQVEITLPYIVKEAEVLSDQKDAIL